ncbi:XVIPCD domain-containing protein, partial [Xanthomonas hyacinthi]
MPRSTYPFRLCWGHAALAQAGAAVDGAFDGAGRQTRQVAAQVPASAAAVNATVFAGTAANVQYNPLFATANVVNIAASGTLLRQVASSTKEATERHLMTETVVPSLDARIQDIGHKARQHVAPERSGPQASGLPGVSGRGTEVQAERERALSPATAPEPGPQRAAPAVSSLPADLRDPAHPGHAEFKHSLREVHCMEAGQGIASGPHSEKVAAALLVAAERDGQRITNVAMGPDGQVQGRQRFSAFDAPKTVQIDPRRAQSVAMHDYASQWAQLRSPHLLSQAPPAERTAAQAQGIAALSAA